MVILLGLHLLGTLDGAFTSYRAFASRCGLIRRRRPAAWAFARGALAAQLALGLVELGGLGLVGVTGQDPSLLLPAGVVMLEVFGLYAAVVAVAFALRTIPSIDAQSATSLLLFGPLTLARPLVIATGVSVAVVAVPTALTAALGAAVLLASWALGRGVAAWVPPDLPAA